MLIFVAWCWDAGSGDDYTNREGTIVSQVRSNGDFSIIKYTGTGVQGTVGHGLDNPAQFVIIKRLDFTGQWRTWHSSLGNTQALNLNDGSSVFDDNSFNETIPTHTVFSVNTNVANVNESDGEYLAYCWAESPTQSFGEYIGTEAEQTVELGFAPSFVLIKSRTSSEQWYIYDTARQTDSTYPYLNTNLTSAEGSSSSRNVELTNSGFTIVGTDGAVNSNNIRYIYVAFGQNSKGTQLTFENDRDLKYLSPGDDVRQDNSPATPTTSAITNVGSLTTPTYTYSRNICTGLDFTRSSSSIALMLKMETLVLIPGQPCTLIPAIRKFLIWCNH